jgi:hypothetical protein
MGPRCEYQVLATRCRDGWFIDVPSLSVQAQSRRLFDAEGAVRNAISTRLDVAADSFDVAIELHSAADDPFRARR